MARIALSAELGHLRKAAPGRHVRIARKANSRCNLVLVSVRDVSQARMRQKKALDFVFIAREASSPAVKESQSALRALRGSLPTILEARACPHVLSVRGASTIQMRSRDQKTTVYHVPLAHTTMVWGRPSVLQRIALRAGRPQSLAWRRRAIAPGVKLEHIPPADLSLHVRLVPAERIHRQVRRAARHALHHVAHATGPHALPSGCRWTAVVSAHLVPDAMRLQVSNVQAVYPGGHLARATRAVLQTGLGQRETGETIRSEENNAL